MTIRMCLWLQRLWVSEGVKGVVHCEFHCGRKSVVVVAPSTVHDSATARVRL